MKSPSPQSARASKIVDGRTACFAVAALFFTFGCHSPKTKVAQYMDGLRVSWQTNLTLQASLGEKALTWEMARAQLLTGNTKLRQARMDVTNSVDSVRQVYKDLLPSLNMHAGLARSIKSLAATGVDDVTFSADSFFNIPGLVGLGARLYAAKLFELRTRTAYVLAEREQTIALYKLFLSAQDLQTETLLFGNQKATADAIQKIDPFTGQVMRTDTEIRELSNLKDWEGIQDQASELFGDRSYRWRFQTNDLPDLHYDTNPLPLADTNRVAQLQMKLVALELDAARATILGIKLRYWPELSLFVTGPPLYQQYAGQSVFWSASDVRASADVFWNIDTHGYISRQLRETKRQQKLQQDGLKQQALQLMDKLLFTQKIITATQEKIRQLDAQLQILLAIPPAQSYFALEKYASDYRSITQSQRRLHREMTELKTLFWFVDEDAWPPEASVRFADAK